MNRTVWVNAGRFLLLMAIQLLVLNQVYLGGYIMPMLYVLFILMLPTGMKRIPLLLIAFGTGLCVDIMSNVLGFHALACTVLAMLRIWFGDRILTRGETTVVETPSIYSVTPQYFVSYLMVMLAVFYTILFGTELFGARGFLRMMWAVVCSTVATTALAVFYQMLFVKRKSET